MKVTDLCVSWSNLTSIIICSLVSAAVCVTALTSENVWANTANTNCSHVAEGTWFLLSNSFTQQIAVSATAPVWPPSARQPNVAKWKTLVSNDAGAWAAAVCRGTQLKTWHKHCNACNAVAAALLSSVRRWWPAEPDDALWDSLLWRKTPINHQNDKATTFAHWLYHEMILLYIRYTT